MKKISKNINCKGKTNESWSIIQEEKKLSSHGIKKTFMFSAFTASVFTNGVRCNQADNVNNTNINAFKIEERKQVREHTY